MEKSANGAAGAAQKDLVLVVELHDVGLNACESIESFAAADGIGVSEWFEGMDCGCSEMRVALRLDAIELEVEVADLRAEIVLLRDASFQAIDVKRDDVGARVGKSGGKRIEKREALFEEFEKLCGFGAHGSSSFIKLMLFLFRI
jgi:hypothetical protein